MNHAVESTRLVPPEVEAVFAGLAQYVYRTSDSEQVYAAICAAACQIVPGCDHAAVMQRDGYATVAATSDLARQAQKLERETGEGACVDTIEADPIQLEANLHIPRRWGRLAAQLITETPLRGALAFRLLVDHRKIGSLNLFSETVNALDATALERGILLASFATVAATTPVASDDADTVSQHSPRNREVDNTIRTLMVLHGRSEQQTYGRLQRISHNVNIKLEDLAAMGNLRAGFTAMATGLNHQQRVRELFGRHVGGSVAAAAEREPPNRDGEERHVALVFVDITGSTQMITSRSASDIMRVLNRFFAVIVDEVDCHHGLVNKFEGDAALAVFGAPNRVDNPENEALATGRAIADRLAREVPEYQAGVGVAAGTVVSGNVGTDKRYEYTVIGEPVHQAARLCEQAKTERGRLLTSATTIEAAGDTERAHWQAGDAVTLRGYREPILLATPA